MGVTLLGVIREGRVVLDYPLPEGTRVEVRVADPPDLREEFAAWGRTSDRALALTDRLNDGGAATEYRVSRPEDRTMAKYLISFPGPAMAVPAEDMPAVGEAARAVIRQAKAAGVYVFGGGINADIAPQMVAADGTVTTETYPQTRDFDGGFCVLELPSREAAVQWAARLATACRCSQELREFGYDPES